jgi:ABC-type lipoprotein export system ATPase subunit
MIRVENASKLYGQPGPDGAAVHALNGVNLRIAAGEFVSIMGPSGCGKSTLLHVLGGLDRLTSGEIFLDDLAIHGLDENGLTELRRRKIGFIFQFFNLLPTLTVEENIRLPGLLQKVATERIEERNCWRRSGSRTGRGIGCTSFPAARCSAPRWPARFCFSRRCCWPMNPRAISIPKPARAW